MLRLKADFFCLNIMADDYCHLFIVIYGSVLHLDDLVSLGRNFSPPKQIKICNFGGNKKLDFFFTHLAKQACID
jgi:hypothetical protein